MNRLTRFLLLVSLLGFSKPSPLFAKGEGYPVGTVHIDLQGNVVPLAVKPPPPPGVTPVPAVLSPTIDIILTQITPVKGSILVCPGGAYHGLAVFGEGVPAADFLNRLGYDVAILEYTHAPVKFRPDAVTRSEALQDALTAVTLLKEKGAKLGLHTDTLGMMGFSAGGHLTARTLHELGAASPFTRVILIYPAYLNTPKVPNSNAPIGITDDVKPVPGSKPMVFVAIGDLDNAFWIPSARVYSEAAKANGQEAEFHLLRGIKHGFGMKPGDAPSTADFQNALTAFLNK